MNSTRQLADSPDDPVADLELDTEALVKDGKGGWLGEVVYPIRVLYVGHNKTQLQGAPLSAGLPHPGLYNLLVSHQFKPFKTFWGYQHCFQRGDNKS